MALQKIGTFKIGDQAIDIRSDVKKVERQIKRFGGSLGNAQARAMNRAANKAKTVAKKGIVQAYNIKAGPIGRALALSPRAKAKRLTVAVRARGPRNLTVYKWTKNKPKPTPLGVRYNTGGGMKVHPHQFIQTMPSGHKGVFVRKTKKRTRKDIRVSPTTGGRYSTHLPIREITYPSVPRMLFHSDVREDTFRMFRNDYPKQLTAQLDFELQKAKGLT